MKILITILFCLFSVVGFSQIPTNPYLGAPSTRTLNRGIFQSDSGAVVSYNFTDTISANLGVISTIPNILIIVNDTVYKRSNDASAWRQITGSGGGSGTINGTSDNLLLVSGANLNVNKTFTDIAWGTTVVWDMQDGYNRTLTLTGDANLTFSNVQDGDQGTLIVVMAGAGFYTLTVPDQTLYLNLLPGDTTIVGWIIQDGVYYFSTSAIRLTVGTNSGSVVFPGLFTTMTFPATTASIARTDSSNTFTDIQTFLATPVLSSGLITSNSVTHTLPSVAGTVMEYKQSSTAAAATPTPTGDAKRNEYYLTAQSTTGTFAAPSGVLINGNTLYVRIKDNGSVAQLLAWNAIYVASPDLPLPTTTVLGKTMYLSFIYNSATPAWNLVGFVNNF